MGSVCAARERDVASTGAAAQVGAARETPPFLRPAENRQAAEKAWRRLDQHTIVQELVISAKPGIQAAKLLDVACQLHWIRAFAGPTNVRILSALRSANAFFGAPLVE